MHSSTLVKISHLVASLPTSCQQLVFAMLVPSCQQVWNKLLTISNNPLLILMIRLVTQLFQQVRYSHDIAVLLQPCVVNLVTFLFIMTVSNLLEQLGANTTCRQLVNRLVTTCLQTCNNLCVFTCTTPPQVQLQFSTQNLGAT